MRGVVAGFREWHVTQIAIYGWKFIAFQISVNFGYGVATSFWFFFLVFYLDDELGLSPSESLALQVRAPPLARCCSC